MQTRKKTHKRALRSKNKYGFWKKLIIACAVITGIGALTTRLFVRQMSTTKSVENQTLVSQINEKNTAISDLQTEIAQLEEKSRVLGMLEGQVSDNQANVYYYSK